MICDKLYNKFPIIRLPLPLSKNGLPRLPMERLKGGLFRGAGGLENGEIHVIHAWKIRFLIH